MGYYKGIRYIPVPGSYRDRYWYQVELYRTVPGTLESLVPVIWTIVITNRKHSTLCDTVYVHTVSAPSSVRARMHGSVTVWAPSARVPVVEADEWHAHSHLCTMELRAA